MRIKDAAAPLTPAASNACITLFSSGWRGLHPSERGPLGLPGLPKSLNFQLEIFPHIRPISFVRGEVVFRKGEQSRELMFLVDGEIRIYSPMDNRVAGVLTKNSETLYGSDGLPVVRMWYSTKLVEGGLRRVLSAVELSS